MIAGVRPMIAGADVLEARRGALVSVYYGGVMATDSQLIAFD